MMILQKLIPASVSSFHAEVLKRARRCSRAVAAKKELWQMLGSTKLHGCYRLYAGKTYAKVFWLIVMICAGIVFSEVVIKLIYLFRNSNVNTQVEIVYEDADDPVVSICSYNILRKSYIEELMRTKGFSLNLLNYILYLYSPLENFRSEAVEDEMRVGQALLEDFMAKNPNFSLLSFVSDASQRCEDFILKCFFENIEFDCCDPLYTLPVLTDLGRCYQTSIAQLRRHLKPPHQLGVTQGLEILLDYRTDEQIPAANDSGLLVRRPFLNVFETGFRIYIHDDMAVAFMSTEMVSVSPNSKIAIALRPTKYQFLERSVGGACRSSWPTGYDNGFAYSETLCEAICIAHYFIDNCGCTPLRFDILRDGNTCSPQELYDCMTNKFPMSSKLLWFPGKLSGMLQLMPECAECAPQCDSFVYYSHNSYAHGILPSTVQYMAHLGARFTPEYVRQNVVELHVFFEAKRFVLYSQSRLSDLTNVLSNIGGNMGLFLGASVLSLFELAVVTFKAFWSLISTKRAIYMQSKRMKEDARKKRLEEVLNNSEMYKEVSSTTSQTSEESPSLEDESTPRPATRKHGTCYAQVEELSVESLSADSAAMVSLFLSCVLQGFYQSNSLQFYFNKRQDGEPRERTRTVSLFLTRELAEALLRSRTETESSIRVAFTNNKLVVPKTIGRTRSYTVV